MQFDLINIGGWGEGIIKKTLLSFHPFLFEVEFFIVLAFFDYLNYNIKSLYASDTTIDNSFTEILICNI